MIEELGHEGSQRTEMVSNRKESFFFDKFDEKEILKYLESMDDQCQLGVDYLVQDSPFSEVCVSIPFISVKEFRDNVISDVNKYSLGRHFSIRVLDENNIESIKKNLEAKKQIEALIKLGVPEDIFMLQDDSDPMCAISYPVEYDFTPQQILEYAEIIKKYLQEQGGEK